MKNSLTNVKVKILCSILTVLFLLSASFSMVFADLDTEPPSAPSDFSISDITDNTITLVWSASTDNEGVSEYAVYSNGELMGTSASLSYTLTNVSDGLTYMLSVKAKDSAGNISGESNMLCIYHTSEDTVVTQILTAPSSLQISAISGDKLSLVWQGMDGAGYDIEYEVYCNNELIGTTNSTNYVVENLVNGEVYAFKVRTKNSFDQTSEFSNIVCVYHVQEEVVVIPVLPPTNLAIDSIVENSVTIKWDSPISSSGVLYYEIYDDDIKIGETSANEFTVNGLVNEGVYMFTVKAVYSEGNLSPKSNVVCLYHVTDVEPDTEAPSKPTGLTLVSLTDTTVTISWTASTDNVGVTSYKVYSGTALKNTLTGATTECTITGLTANIQYSFTIEAWDEEGNVSTSDAFTTITNAAVHINSDLMLTQNVEYYDLYLDNNGTINLNGFTMTVWGTLTQPGGTMNINGGTLNVKNDYKIEKKNTDGSYSYTTNPILKMMNSADRVIVEKDFYIRSANTLQTSNYLTDGILEVKGNFSQNSPNDGSYYTFIPSGNHKVLLSGTGEQTVSFLNPSRSGFNDLEITNQAAGNVEFASSIKGWTLKRDIIIPNSISILGTMDLAGYNMTVKGNLIKPSDTININGGKLEVTNDFIIAKVKTDGSYTYCSAILRMNNQIDHVIVNGNFYISTSYLNRLDAASYLTDGTLEVKGDFTQNSAVAGYEYYVFYPSGNHKVLLSGTGVQNVTFANPTYCGFNDLEITNKTVGNIIFNSSIKGWALKRDIIVPNSITIIGTMDLAGKVMSIKGNLLQPSGTMNINNGTLDIAGNYSITNSTGSSYGTGYLCMTNELDQVFVGGNFKMDSTQDHTNYLTAGLLEVRGDFTQKSSGVASYNDFKATGTHRVLLSGKKLQNVNFEDYTTGKSKFNTLVITKDLATGYSFNAQPVWTTLIKESEVLNSVGSEYEQTFSNLPNLTPPKINNVNIEILNFQKGIYRLTIADDDYSVDENGSAFFFWSAEEGTFSDATDDYRSVVFHSNAGINGRMVCVIVGLGDSLGQTDKKGILLKGSNE